jgi:hypothetical protein
MSYNLSAVSGGEWLKWAPGELFRQHPLVHAAIAAAEAKQPFAKRRQKPHSRRCFACNHGDSRARIKSAVQKARARERGDTRAQRERERGTCCGLAPFSFCTPPPCMCAVAECEWKSPCGAWPTLRLLLAPCFSPWLCALRISAAPRARGREARRQIDLLIAGHTAAAAHTLIANK